MFVTDEFVNWGARLDYTKVSVFDQETRYNLINHVISIVGYDKDDQGEYWIGRNSWGRHWGYDGFFYVRMGKNVLGLESDCVFSDASVVEI